MKGINLHAFPGKYGLGMRTIKTGIAVFLCLCVGYLAQTEFPLYACLAAIVTMQDTAEKSFSTGIIRLIGTGIGGVVGVLALWLMAGVPHPFAQAALISVAVILGLMICYVIRQQDACSICAVVIAVILIGHTTQEVFVYAFGRVLETALGVVITVPVNRYLWPRVAENPNKKNPA